MRKIGQARIPESRKLYPLMAVARDKTLPGFGLTARYGRTCGGQARLQRGLANIDKRLWLIRTEQVARATQRCRLANSSRF